MDLNLKNKRILITGGSKGIGKSIAEAFYKEKSKLTLIARNEKLVKKVINNFGGSKNDHHYFACDLNKKNNPKKIAKKILKTLGSHDVIIHNIGGGLGVNDIFAPLEDWLKVWNFNVGISIEINNILIKNMIENKKNGKIIYISSISSLNSDKSFKDHVGKAAYAASKSFLNSYMKCLAKSLAKNNILVNAVLPGAVINKGKYWDKMQKKYPNEVKKYLKSVYPIERFARPIEIASMVVFLASELSSFTTGSLINIDGGST